ncbi:uncharacterized protein LOC114066954 isoform X1 [Empidonax traillii]|uniref:uncharacterized protein LOC114066954 isoform X1 n=1 Tax=Empidonax traillii TaxID=164674 RepID=UPI000FFD3295|nr:uncharacterized protein LOC114066954 isoform X1 [Empidonax traillii]
MEYDWLGFGYAALVAAGGVVGYAKAGSVPSLAAGLLFGGLAGLGAYQQSKDPKNVWLSLGLWHCSVSKHGSVVLVLLCQMALTGLLFNSGIRNLVYCYGNEILQHQKSNAWDNCWCQFTDGWTAWIADDGKAS